MPTNPTLQLHPYLIQPESGPAIAAEWGQILVPENRQKENSRLISLPFVRIPSSAENPGTPVVFLQGGPGFAMLSRLPRLWDLPMLRPNAEAADCIFVEQRGVGASRPNLECPETYDLPLVEPGSAEATLEAHRSYLGRALAFWSKQGVDISGYNVRQMAADIDDLRQALSYERISLMGGSFGSHHGLAMLRYYGQTIERALLWSVEGPNHTIKLPGNIQVHLEKLNKLLKKDAELNGRIPDLLDLMASVLDRLERHPVTVQTVHPQTGEDVAITLGKYDLQLATADGLGSTRFLSALPARYLSLAGGDYTWLGELAIKQRVGLKSNLMYEAVDYASGATAGRRALIAKEAPGTLLGDVINEPFHQLDDLLGELDLGNEFRGRLVCAVPTLLVCGTLDFRTPVSNAAEILPDLSNGQLLTVEGASHDLAFRGEHIDEFTCIRDQFFRGEPIQSDRLHSNFVFDSPASVNT